MGVNTDFINKHFQEAVNATKGTGLLPEVALVQSMLESANGTSGLSKPPFNNYFGIKAGAGWTGGKALFKTREVLNGKSVMVDAYFRTYSSYEDSIKGWVTFLVSNPRYTHAGLFTAKTPTAQFAALKKAGYATDPNYVSALSNFFNSVKTSIIENYKKININPTWLTVSLLPIFLGAFFLYKYYRS